MRVVITGGAGFLGSRLARKILERGTLAGSDGAQRPLQELVLFDIAAATGFDDPRVKVVTGDVADPATLRALIGSGTQSVFHLAAIVSGQAEAEFDLGMRINFDATRHLLEALRQLPRPARLVFSSSLAVFGATGPEDMPEVIGDDTALTPLSSYGVQKAMGELMVNDYSRKGFVDGRSLRLPTITVRPGKPNAAASSFASGIIREPLQGINAECPVAPEARMWLSSPRTAIENLIHGHELDGAALGFNRALSLPGLTVTVADMVSALASVAGEAVAARVHFRPDEKIARLVSGWPGALDTTRALAQGFGVDADFVGFVRAHIAESSRAY